MQFNTIGLTYRRDNLGVKALFFKRLFDIVVAIIPCIICTILWIIAKRQALLWWQVLKGESSVVGPQRYSDEEISSIRNISLDYEYLQGIPTGIISESAIYLPQETTTQERIEADVRYCEHRTLAMDLMIIIDFLRKKIKN